MRRQVIAIYEGTMHPWQGGTTYGAVDSLDGPSMATMHSPVGPSLATNFVEDCPAGPVVRGPSLT